MTKKEAHDWLNSDTDNYIALVNIKLINPIITRNYNLIANTKSLFYPVKKVLDKFYALKYAEGVAVVNYDKTVEEHVG